MITHLPEDQMEAKPLLQRQPGLHIAAPGWNGKIRQRAARLAAVDILHQAYRAAERSIVPGRFGTSWTEGLSTPRFVSRNRSSANTWNIRAIP